MHGAQTQARMHVHLDNPCHGKRKRKRKKGKRQRAKLRRGEEMRGDVCGRPCTADRQYSCMPSQIMVWAMERAGGRVGNWQRPTCGSGGTRTSPSEPLRPRLLLYKTDRRPQFPFSHLRPVRIYFEFPPPRLLLCLGASLSASPPSPPRRSASRPAVPRRPIRARPIRQGMATFELYRRSTIGTCLTETLDELVSSGAVSPELAIQVLVQFDKSMTEALEMQVKSKVNVKGHLHTYRFCDNVWTFILTDATFKSEEIQETLGKVKIVACDSKLLQPQQP